MNSRLTWKKISEFDDIVVEAIQNEMEKSNQKLER